MSDRDIIVIYVKEYTLKTEEYDSFNNYMKETNEDKNTKIIIVPIEVVERVERL